MIELRWKVTPPNMAPVLQYRQLRNPLAPVTFGGPPAVWSDWIDVPVVPIQDPEPWKAAHGEASQKCAARKYSDQMHCSRCALTWDMNDPVPPWCEVKRMG